MAEVLGLEQQHLVDLVVDRRHDLIERFRTGRLGEMFAKASEIEPLIGECWPEVTRPKMVPLTTPLVVDEVAALHQAHAAADFRPARLILVINRARWGAGRRMEGHLAHAMATYVRPDEIVVIYTDDSTKGPDDRFPEGVREVDFFAIGGGLSDMQAEHALVTFIRTLHADAVVNINSKLLYQAMRTYGKALAATERVFLCFFCNEQTTMGTWRGWSLRTFYRTFDDVTGVITDSHHLRDELVDTYRVSGRHLERLHVFSAPVDPRLPLVSGPRKDPERRPQVFWAGRWDRQKRVGLVVQLAQKMPDVDFRMWGAPVMGSRPRDLRWNVKAEGVYENISAIPLAEADVWLYTSGWDGVPSQLLEVAMTGIPIVGTLVGGTGEVLTRADSWPIPVEEDVEAYERAIRAVLADPGRARKRPASCARGWSAIARRRRSRASPPRCCWSTARSSRDRPDADRDRPQRDRGLGADHGVGRPRGRRGARGRLHRPDRDRPRQRDRGDPRVLPPGRFDHWERWIREEGDLGRVRNALVPQTDGRYIAFLDADDLFSENWLAEALAVLKAADERGERVIAHPELNIVFDGGQDVCRPSTRTRRSSRRTSCTCATATTRCA